MLRLISSKAQRHKDFWKPSKPCHVGIHWIALAVCSQMSTHVPGFQSLFSVFLQHFVLAKWATSSIRVEGPLVATGMNQSKCIHVTVSGFLMAAAAYLRKPLCLGMVSALLDEGTN